MLKKYFAALIYACYLILCFCAALRIVPGFLGMETRVVLSGSMEPVCPAGSLLLIRFCKAEDISEGDILTYSCGDGTVVTHRVYANHPDTRSFVTKGDANDTPDLSEVPYDAVIGRPVFMLPFLGYLLAWTTSRAGRFFLCCFVAGSLGFLLLSHPWKGSVKEA